MQTFTRSMLLAMASGATLTFAQTFTSCNPTLKECPADPALGKAVEYDFTKGAPEDFTVADGTAPKFTSEGAEFTITKSGDAPTISSKWFMMFGSYEIKAKIAKGQGIVSSLVLQSDDLDEIDYEWIGGDADQVQTNYFGKGLTTVYTRNQTLPDPNSQSDFITYGVDWSADSLTWSVNGKVIRTLTPDTAVPGQYPQTPMQLKIGNWAGGDPKQPKGTIEWAGGLTDFSKGPFTFTISSVKAVDYSTGKSYSYGDKSGTWQSIKSDGGKINSKGDPNQQASQASAQGTAISQTGGSAATNAPVSGAADGKAVSTASGAAPSGTDAAKTTLSTASGAAAPYPKGNGTTNGTAQTTGASSSSTSQGASGTAKVTGSPKTGSAARVGASIGAVAFAAAIMVL